MSINVDTKYIVIEDFGRDLTPIGYGFKSPILKPSKFPIDTIRRLLSVSGVKRMYEVYPGDHSIRVLLDKSNYNKPFNEIWKEANPGMEFPWDNGVVEVSTDTNSPSHVESINENKVEEVSSDDDVEVSDTLETHDQEPEAVSDVKDDEPVQPETQIPSAEVIESEESTGDIAEDNVIIDSLEEQSPTELEEDQDDGQPIEEEDITDGETEDKPRRKKRKVRKQ